MAATCGACDVSSECDAADLSALNEDAHLAVISSLFRQSSSVGFLDRDGQVVTEAWIDSGSTAPGVVSALGGDVVFPTQMPMGELWLIERIGIDLLTRIALPSGSVIAQLATQGSANASGAYRSNPQDAIRWNDGKAYVTRLEPNLVGADTESLDQGNDLLEIDLNTGKPKDRVPLDELNRTVEGTTVYARPGRMVRVGDRLTIGLSLLSSEFDISAPGATAVFDVTSNKLHSIALDPLRNCSEVRPVPDEPDLVAVLCSGSTFATIDDRRESAGVAVIDAAANPPTLRTLWKAEDATPPQLGLIPLSKNRMLYVSQNVDGMGSDHLVEVTLDTGSTRLLKETRLADSDRLLQFDLGYGVYDAMGGTVWVPSATQGILRFDDDNLAQNGSVDASPCRRLPARELAFVQF